MNLTVIVIATMLRAPCYGEQQRYLDSYTVKPFVISPSYYLFDNRFYRRALPTFGHYEHKKDYLHMLRLLARTDNADAFLLLEDDACPCEHIDYESVLEAADGKGCGFVSLSIGMLAFLVRRRGLECLQREIVRCHEGGIDVCAHRCDACFTARDYFSEEQRHNSTLGHGRMARNDCRLHDSVSAEDRFQYLDIWLRNNWLPRESIKSRDL